MRRALECDFFLGEEEPGEAGEHERLRVFAGPRGILIADARVCLGRGCRVRHGEAWATGTGLELIYHSEEDGGGPQRPYCVEMRFVVKGASYDPALPCAIRNVHQPGGD